MVEAILGWTFETLKHHILSIIDSNDTRYEQRFLAQQQAVQDALLAQEKLVNAALISADRAVTKAEIANEKRFEGVNEFRKTLSDQALSFMPRAEVLALLKSYDDKLVAVTTEQQQLRDFRYNTEGTNKGKVSAETVENVKASINNSILIAAAIIVTQIALHFVK